MQLSGIHLEKVKQIMEFPKKLPVPLTKWIATEHCLTKQFWQALHISKPQVDSLASQWMNPMSRISENMEKDQFCIQ